MTSVAKAVRTRVPGGVIAALPLLLPLFVLGLLGAFLDVDPAAGVTSSRSPFSDEGWIVFNARNQALFGTSTTDDWNMSLVYVVFPAIQSVVFGAFGVGIVQARFVSVVAVAATTGALAFGLRGVLGRVPAFVAAVAFGSSLLVLYYGRLALLEPLVALWLTVAALIAARAGDDRAGRWGLAAGVTLALAIGTKPNAAFSAAGMLLAVALVDWRSPAVRRWLAGAVAVVVTAAAGWLAAIGLPQREAVMADIRIWPSAELPTSPLALVRAIGSYVVRSDGGLPASAPMAIGGGVGAIVGVGRRREFSPPARRVVAASIGWLIGGGAPLFLTAYHANRYVVPLLPAVAILGAAGLSVAARTLAPRLRPSWTIAALTVLLAGLALPGLLAYAGWIRGGTRDLLASQVAVERILPRGAVVQGDFAPLFAMRAPVTTIVAWAAGHMNSGDEYVDRGVRWLLVDVEGPPRWTSQHPEAWAARQTEYCTTWGGEGVCLYRLP